MARQLTEQQQKFLSVLFEEAGGDVLTAKKLAGYSDTTSTTHVVNSLKGRDHRCYSNVFITQCSESCNGNGWGVVRSY